MELDDVKQAFHDFDGRLARQSALTLGIRRDRGVGRVRASLRPLVFGHAAQVVAGILVALFAGRAWMEHLREPHLLAAGLVVHAYAVLMIALGAHVLWMIQRLDFAAPILSIQKQIAVLRRSYARTGLVIGLPWWLLWIPFGMLLFAGVGVDFYAAASRAWLAANLVVGLAGIGITLWWSRSIWRKRSDAGAVDDREAGMSGNSLRNAQRILDEIREFEKE